MTDIDTTEPTLRRAHKHCTSNAEALKNSNLAACFYCCKAFPACRVVQWVHENDGTRTARCPHCGIDSVIADSSGYALNKRFLSAMEQRWFGDE